MEFDNQASVGDTMDADFIDCLDILDNNTWNHESDQHAFASLTGDELQQIVTQNLWGQTHRKAPVHTNVVRHYKQEIKCVECGGLMAKTGVERVCSDCGVTETMDSTVDGISTLTIGSYNTSNESANPVRVIGPGGVFLQKKLMCAASDYDKTKHRATQKIMANVTQKYKDCVIPMNVVNLAAERYFEIQRVGTIKRGNVHSGSMAACLMRTCDQAGIHKKRDVFAKMFNIGLADLSVGEKLIDNYVAEGRIKREDFQIQHPEQQNTDAYIIQYFINLKIPLPQTSDHIMLAPTETNEKPERQYFTFVSRLIEFAIRFKVADNSVIYSKCAGAIHVLATRCSELNITAEKISKECMISKSTFKRFSNAIQELLNSSDERKLRLKKKLRHVFKVNGIPI